jgi:hypothetical protein
MGRNDKICGGGEMGAKQGHVAVWHRWVYWDGSYLADREREVILYGWCVGEIGNYAV